MYDAFHFDSLVWNWPIAIYLFLLGIAAGTTTIAILLKRYVLTDEKVSENGIIRAVAIIAPISVGLSMLILITHLTKPWAFWKVMVHFNLGSVMSLGTILFQVFTMVLVAWLVVIFKDELKVWLPKQLNFVHPLIALVAKLETLIEWTLMLLAVLLGVYTGFLLSALKTYPMLNNPVLPVLFLFSGISSGAAAALLMGTTVFKTSPHSPSVSFIHKVETPVVLLEILLLFAFFTGLYFGGGQKEAAAVAAIGGGFWSNVFWYGVIGLGILLPMVLKLVTPSGIQHKTGFIAVLACFTLAGVLMLRYFVLYAGQMTVV